MTGAHREDEHRADALRDRCTPTLCACGKCGDWSDLETRVHRVDTIPARVHRGHRPAVLTFRGVCRAEGCGFETEPMTTAGMVSAAAGRHEEEMNR